MPRSRGTPLCLRINRALLLGLGVPVDRPVTRGGLYQTYHPRQRFPLAFDVVGASDSRAHIEPTNQLARRPRGTAQRGQHAD